jgi:hypothetical protein
MLPDESVPPVIRTPLSGIRTAAAPLLTSAGLPVATQLPVGTAGIDPRSRPDERAAASATTEMTRASLTGVLVGAKDELVVI